MGEGYIHNWEHRLREAVRNLEAIVARELSDTSQEIGKRVDSWAVTKILNFLSGGFYGAEGQNRTVDTSLFRAKGKSKKPRT